MVLRRPPQTNAVHFFLPRGAEAEHAVPFNDGNTHVPSLRCEGAWSGQTAADKHHIEFEG